MHIKKDHREHPSYDCDNCDKKFVTKFRLRKHTQMHSDIKIGTCRYFRNNVFCPFEELGCKFLHCTDKNIEKLERMSESENRSIITNNSGQTENDFEKFQFYTSTPRKLGHSKSYQNVKEKLNCENCLHKSQCSDCYVNEYIQRQKHDTKMCRICDGNIKIEEKEFECDECDKFVCARYAKETHSEEFFTSSPCLL